MTAVLQEQLRELKELSRSISASVAEVLAHDDMAGPPAARALRRLLAGEQHAGDEQLLGVAVRGSRVLVLRVADEHDERRVRRVLDEERCLVSVRWRALTRAALVPSRAGAAPTRAEVQRVVQRVSSMVRTVGVSAELRAAGDLRHALDDAIRASVYGTDAPAFVEDVWTSVAVDRLREQVVGCLPAENPVSRLLAHDADTGGDLTTSLLVWLQANCEVPPAAAELGVHVNTLRYRLGRIQRLTGLDLRDPRARALSLLALG